MTRILPPLNALRAFEAAGRHQSFSLAAHELGVSHSAISRHVRGLEDRLNARLFRDLPRGVALTQDGRAYLDRITPALDAIADATEGLVQVPSGRLTVNAEPLFAAKVLIPLLPDFHAAFPEVDLRLEASQTLTDVERYEADLAIRFASRGVLDAPSDLLSDAPLYPYGAPGLVARGAPPRALLDFTRFRDRDTDIWQMWFARAGIDNISEPNPAWRLTASLAYEAALNGNGVYLSSSECTHRDETAGRLIRLSDICLRHGSFHLVYGARGPRGSPARRFRAWLLDVTSPYRTPKTAEQDQPSG